MWDDDGLRSPHAQPDKSRRVRRMFDAIAPTYERVNSLFSVGLDARWRRRAVELVGLRGHERLLDVCTGTGDFARTFADALPRPRWICGVDFSAEMLVRAITRRRPGLCYCQADGLHLPFRDGSFDIVSCAFGVRNFQDLDTGLTEMFRVLASSGRAVILEFTRPNGDLRRRLYEFYTGRIMPIAAAWISRDRTGAYRYLPRSVLSFPDAAEMGERLNGAGFREITTVPFTFGAVTIYLARKNAHG